MRRREFIAALGGAAAWPVAGRAQPPKGRVAHIAYLGLTSPSVLDPRQIEQFKRGLAENGLIEGRDITVEYLWAEGNPERLNQFALELARRDLDVIDCWSAARPSAAGDPNQDPDSVCDPHRSRCRRHCKKLGPPGWKHNRVVDGKLAFGEQEAPSLEGCVSRAQTGSYFARPEHGCFGAG